MRPSPPLLWHPHDIPDGGWEKDAVQAFATRLMDKNQLFPCVFGVDALKRGTLRFAFAPAGEGRVPALADALDEFLPKARELGNRTSLVVFFEHESGLATMKDYEAHFWILLQELHHRDRSEWPNDISIDTEDPTWEFSFAGTPLFVVANTPSHKARQSRYFDYFCITFQPRFVFDDLKEGSPQGKSARKIIRKRLSEYDHLEPTPLLSGFGIEGNREWTQHFLPDENSMIDEGVKCPFHMDSSNTYEE